MKIINNGLPPVIFEWLQTDFYDAEAAAGSISATSLLKPTQEYLLTKRHWDELEVDATERIWSLFGSSVHAVLDKLEGDTEERLFCHVRNSIVSGKYDRVQDNTITDYKVTSVWTVVYKSREKEWSEQMSIYRWLYWKNKGIKLNDYCSIIAILRDWDKKKVGGNYPILPIIEIKLDLMSLESTETFIEERVRLIEESEGKTDSELPECSKSERWWNEKKQEFIKCSSYCLGRKYCQQLQRYDVPPISEVLFGKGSDIKFDGRKGKETEGNNGPRGNDHKPAFRNRQKNSRVGTSEKDVKASQNTSNIPTETA